MIRPRLIGQFSDRGESLPSAFFMNGLIERFNERVAQLKPFTSLAPSLFRIYVSSQWRCCLLVLVCNWKKVFSQISPLFFFAAANYRDNFRPSDFLSLRLTLERNSAAFGPPPRPRNISPSALACWSYSSARTSKTFLFFFFSFSRLCT